jgi:hypothetical protein
MGIYPQAMLVEHDAGDLTLSEVVAGLDRASASGSARAP